MFALVAFNLYAQSDQSKKGLLTFTGTRIISFDPMREMPKMAWYSENQDIRVDEIEVSKLSDSIVVKFIDSGKKFNPLEIAEPNIHAPLEERSIGGLGIFMTKKLSDTLSYERSNGKNIFTITKNF